MDKENLDYYYQFALKTVKEAGKIIKEAKNIKIETKVADWDLVTEFDRKVEDVLITSLKNEFPSHKFIGEESSAESNSIPELTDDPTWIIDPIDGTTNFCHGFPFSCISVGLSVNKEEILGIVYNPTLEECFHAAKGKGAYCNDKRIHVSKIEEVSKSVIGYEISIARNEKWTDIYMERCRALVTVSQAIRSMGCAALGLCYVANGCTDVYLADGLKPWDSAGGVVIVREAGGYVCHTDGSKFDVMVPHFLAGSNEKIATSAIKLIKEADEKLKTK